MSLWFIYFGRAEQVAVSHASTVDDPIRTVHLGINAIYGVVVGLVVLATGAELVLAHPDETRAGLGGCAPPGRPDPLPRGAGDLLPDDHRSRLAATGRRSRPARPRAAAAYWLPAMVAVALLVIVLLALAVQLSREREAADAGDTPIPESI